MTVETLPVAASVDSALTRAVDYLEQKQLPSGEFRMCRFSDVVMESNLQVNSTPYGTAYVLYSLAFSNDPRIAAMHGQASAFLLSEMEAPGLWRYFSLGNAETLPLDLDDTACAAYVLKDAHDYLRLGLNHRLFLINRDSKGRFRTFLSDRSDDNLCGLVNANVVLYLGEREETLAACDYLVSLTNQDDVGKRTLYGVDDLLFYYVLSRAYFHGVTRHGATRLAKARDAAIAAIVGRRDEEGSLGGHALHTSMAISSLLNFDAAEPRLLMDGIRYLLESQSRDGSWPCAAFYIDFDEGYYGSEEVTTALCIEALARWAQATNH